MPFSLLRSRAAEPVAVVSAPSVLDDVNRRLRESSYYYLRTIQCAYDEGVLTLRGIVPSYYLKQTAQTLAEKADGVEQVVNLVYVASPAGVP